MHIDRLMAVLETIAVAGRALTAVDVHGATGLPRPTCYRLLQSLLDNRLLDDPDGDSRYVIGERLLRVAQLARSDVDVRHACTPALEAAAARFGETVFLARFRDRQVEIIHVEMPADVTRGFVHPGLGSRPMHACSCSKAIAAFAGKGFRDDILGGTLEAYTRYTRTTPKRLRAEFAKIVDQGYAECDQEIDMGVSSVAAPVSIGHVGAFYSVGAVGPVRRLTAGRRGELGEKLKRLAIRINAAIELSDVANVRISDLSSIASGNRQESATRQH